MVKPDTETLQMLCMGIGLIVLVRTVFQKRVKRINECLSTLANDPTLRTFSYGVCDSYGQSVKSMTYSQYASLNGPRRRNYDWSLWVRLPQHPEKYFVLNGPIINNELSSYDSGDTREYVEVVKQIQAAIPLTGYLHFKLISLPQGFKQGWLDRWLDDSLGKEAGSGFYWVIKFNPYVASDSNFGMSVEMALSRTHSALEYLTTAQGRVGSSVDYSANVESAPNLAVLIQQRLMFITLIACLIWYVYENLRWAVLFWIVCTVANGIDVYKKYR